MAKRRREKQKEEQYQLILEYHPTRGYYIQCKIDETIFVLNKVNRLMLKTPSSLSHVQFFATKEEGLRTMITTYRNIENKVKQILNSIIRPRREEDKN